MAARQAHNLEAVGSSPTPATTRTDPNMGLFLFWGWDLNQEFYFSTKKRSGCQPRDLVWRGRKELAIGGSNGERRASPCNVRCRTGWPSG